MKFQAVFYFFSGLKRVTSEIAFAFLSRNFGLVAGHRDDISVCEYSLSS